MKLLSGLTGRLASPDAQQYLALYLIALLFALMASWPTLPNQTNDSWFSLAYTRAAVLGLLGLGYGVRQVGTGHRELRDAALMLAFFALFALPVELAAYAATYPPTPISWLLTVPPLTAVAMFAIGLLLGKLLSLLHLRVLSPIAVPALLVGMVAFDVSTGVNVLNPFTAAVRVSPPHLAVLAVAVLALFVALWRPLRPSEVNDDSA